MATVSTEQYVYKILSDPPPDLISSALPITPLDAQDGFIHLSTLGQVQGTANRFFAQKEVLYILKIPLRALEQGGKARSLKWESNESGIFPHLYGADLGKDDIETIQVYYRRSGDTWSQSLQDMT